VNVVRHIAPFIVLASFWPAEALALAGMDAYLTKPIRSAELYAALENVIHQTAQSLQPIA